MKQTRYLIAIWMLTTTVMACAPKPSEYTEVDEQIAAYFLAFKTEAEARGLDLDMRHLRIHFNQDLVGTDKAGSCTITESKNGDIFSQHRTTHLNIGLNPDKFFNFDDYRRFELLFHELGHCLLGLTHNDRTISVMTLSGLRNLPASWMSTYQNGYYLDNNEKELLIGYYIHQVFEPDVEASDLTSLANVNNYKTFFSMSSFNLLQ